MMFIKESKEFLAKEVYVDSDGHFAIEHGTDTVFIDKEQALELAKLLAFYAVSGRLPE